MFGKSDCTLRSEIEHLPHQAMADLEDKNPESVAGKFSDLLPDTLAAATLAKLPSAESSCIACTVNRQ